MAELTEEAKDRTPVLLYYSCSYWRASSQRAADLYDSGVKLWRKYDLADIEQQLAHSQTMEKFTVRSIDGSVIHTKNPMFGVQKPIWRPYVKFQEYWHLVRTAPDGPPETYHCTYLVDWTNQTIRNYEGPIENVHSLFKERQRQWDACVTCDIFTSQLRQLLVGKRVTKIICFGLGDLNLKPPDWWRIENEAQTKDKQETETSMIEGALTHHSIALTMADAAPAETGNTGIRLLTQDPRYTDETINMLREIGFEVIGEYGAGGFAEIDDNSIVFSAFANAPVKQITADFARPVAIICPRISSAGVFGQVNKPLGDPESPRTKQMWEDYKSWGFPIQPEDNQLKGSLHQLEMYTRIR